MEREEYLILSKVEDKHWWYKSLKRLVFYYLESAKCKVQTAEIFNQNPQTSNTQSLITNHQLPITILDAGCGTGGLLKHMENIEGYKVGVDLSSLALELARKKTKSTLVKSSVENLPFKNNSFSFILSLDVLYHKWIYSDESALKEFNRILQKGGSLILNIPAYNFLYSKHDEKIFTRERYSKNSIIKKLIKSNFNIVKITYWNSLFFPFIALIRLIKKSSKSHKSDLKEENVAINKIMELILLLEFLIIKKISLPFGLSIFIICQKL